MRPDGSCNCGRDRVRTSEAYDGESGTIAAARKTMDAFLSEATAGRPPEVVAEAGIVAALVVSELVTNAVKHAEGRCGMDLLLHHDALEITVWDTSTQQVTVAEPDPSRIGDHGLEIVTALCGGFDVRPTPTGKQITARVPLG